MNLSEGPIYKIGNTILGKELCPSAFAFKVQDISGPNAGRTEDGLMHKMVIRSAVTLDVEWKNIRTEKAHDIFKMIDDAIASSSIPDCFPVTYFNPVKNSFITGIFYVGDRGTPLYNGNLGIWSSIKFNLIER